MLINLLDRCPCCLELYQLIRSYLESVFFYIQTGGGMYLCEDLIFCQNIRSSELQVPLFRWQSLRKLLFCSVTQLNNKPFQTCTTLFNLYLTVLIYCHCSAEVLLSSSCREIVLSQVCVSARVIDVKLMCFLHYLSVIRAKIPFIAIVLGGLCHFLCNLDWWTWWTANRGKLAALFRRHLS